MHKAKIYFQEQHIVEDTKIQFFLKTDAINPGYV